MKTHTLFIDRDIKKALSELKDVQELDKILLSGTLYTARDKAHKRLCELLKAGKDLPFELQDTALYYCGPSPKAPGKACGAIGPTTSSRMDAYTPLLLENGLSLMIGKGERSQAVQEAIAKHQAMYLVCIGGAAALLSKHVQSCEIFTWQELGTEAIYRLEVKDFPTYLRYL